LEIDNGRNLAQKSGTIPRDIQKESQFPAKKPTEEIEETT